MKRLIEEGILDRPYMLIGIAPLTSARSALWIREYLPGSIIPLALLDRLARAADPKAEGRQICLDLLRQFSEMAGVHGVHLMAPQNQRINARWSISLPRHARISASPKRHEGL